MRRLTSLCVVAVLLGSLAAGCGADDEVAADVAGVRYTVENFHAYLATTDPQNEARASRAVAAEWLTNWARFRAIDLELSQRGAEVTNDHYGQAVLDLTSNDSAFRPAAAGSDVLIHRMAVTLAALEWAEREALGSASIEPLLYLCSRHILVATLVEAEDILALLEERVEAGGDASDAFELLAIEYSTDPGSATLGGNLGCVVEGTFVAPFEEAAFAATIGEVVIAETQFGFHVIEVLSAGPVTAQHHPQFDTETLQQIAEEVDAVATERAVIEAQQLQQELLGDLSETAFTDHREQVSISERYGYWDPETFQVILQPVAP